MREKHLTDCNDFILFSAVNCFISSPSFCTCYTIPLKTKNVN